MNIDAIPKINLSTVSSIQDIDFIDEDFAIFDDIRDIPLSNFPNRIDAAVLTVCLSGWCKVGINLQEYTINAGDLLMTVPNEIIQKLGSSDDFSGIFIATTRCFIENTLPRQKEWFTFLLHLTNYPTVNLTKSELECIMEYHTLLWKKVKFKDNPFRREIAQGILAGLLFEIYSIYIQRMPQQMKVKSRKEDIFEQFIDLVSAEYKSVRKVAYYANKLCLTPKYLSGIVKEVGGKTASQWVDDFVILEAKALLKSSDMNVQQISEALHFANQSFFGKYFKHYVGISPKEYRNE